VFHKHASSVQLGVPHPIVVRFFQQQDASLTSRRWGCNSLTGHQEESGRQSAVRRPQSRPPRGGRGEILCGMLTADCGLLPPNTRRHGEAAPHLFREQAKAQCKSGVSDQIFPSR